MKKVLVFALAIMLALSFTLSISAGQALAAKKKYGQIAEDERHKAWKRIKWKTSDKKIRWRMSDTWGGLLNHDAVVHFCDSVRAASGGRLDIKPMTTGSVVGAFELFDAVAKGSLDAGHSWSGYWKGKNEAFTLFASVPFSMDYETYSIWYWQGEGRKLMDELYGQYGLKPFFCGNAGQELGLYSKKPRSKFEDFKGIKVRTPGWFMDILNRIGVNATAIPGSEVYLALERGIVDAAEFSSPAITYGMGFHEICKYVIEPGVHQPSAQMDLFINKKKWEALPADLKAIVEICAAETDSWFYTYNEMANSRAIELLTKAGVTFVKMDAETRNQFRKTTEAYLQELKGKYPDVKKILESQEKFIKYHAAWKELRSGVSVWPAEDYLKGKHYQ
jgi:TRAP-type mannitol/chloroaromatic compound transport system substrate-binding protein